MSRHSGIKPAGQPRSLRSIAESKSNAANFPDGPQAEPELTTGTGGQYVDTADAAKPTSTARPLSSTDPTPFNVKRG